MACLVTVRDWAEAIASRTVRRGECKETADSSAPGWGGLQVEATSLQGPLELNYFVTYEVKNTIKIHLQTLRVEIYSRQFLLVYTVIFILPLLAARSATC